MEPGDEGSGWEEEEEEVLVAVDGATPLDVEPRDVGSGWEEEENEVLVAVDGATPLPGVAVGPACVSWLNLYGGMGVSFSVAYSSTRPPW